MVLNKKIITFLVLTCLVILIPYLASADVYQDNKDNLAPFKTVFGEARDPRLMVASIINIVLGFLGIIFVALILYAGFMWMTAGGNDDKVKKAQTVIRNSTIGLAVVLAAWGITKFIFCALLSATTGDYFWECPL